tara:strand:+ start:124954 stop:125769 length:816 start_codon:yes stop_codon:yes gene_type:complete
MKILLLAFLFSLNIHACLDGEKDIIVSADVPQAQVTKYVSEHIGVFTDALGKDKAAKILNGMKEGTIEYYGGGKFIFKGRPQSHYASIDPDLFKAMGEMLENSKDYRALSSQRVSQRVNQSADSTKTAARNADEVVDSQKIAIRERVSIDKNNLVESVRNAPIVANREVNSQLYEMFLGLSDKLASQPFSKRLIRATGQGNEFSVSLNSELGRVLNALVQRRVSGNITVSFNTNGTVSVANAASVKNYSPEAFNVFIRTATERVHKAKTFQ